jgi:acetyl esterase/lipase
MSFIRAGLARLNRRRTLCRLPVALACLLIWSCSATSVVNTLVPDSDYREYSDQSYGEGPRHKLDIYVPRTAPASAPVVIFFYGGGWTHGDKDKYLFVAEALVSRGLVVVVPDYRLYPEVTYPAFLEDSALAVRWTLDHIGERGGDPNRVYLMGHSAGAYIAAMLSLDRRWLAAVGVDPRRQIRGTIGLAGPYDFLPLETAELKAIFGPPDQWPSTQPINHVEGTAPPMLLMAGSEDKLVKPAIAARLADRIRAKGGRVQEKYYLGIDHRKLVGAPAAPLRSAAPVLDDATHFMNSTAPP